MIPNKLTLSRPFKIGARSIENHIWFKHVDHESPNDTSSTEGGTKVGVFADILVPSFDIGVVTFDALEFDSMPK